MGFGPPPTSPYVYEARDYQRNVIRVTIPYDNTTKVINGTATVHRDPACIYTKVIVGPPSAPTVTVLVPPNDSTYTQAQMAGIGLTSINTIINTQITAIE